MSKIFNRKKAFTLIELIAVMAIIGVLAVAMVPKVSKYMTEAKKVKAVAQARTAITAAEMYNSRNDVQVIGGALISTFAGTVVPASTTPEGIEFEKDTSMVQGLTLDECRAIVNDGSNFTIDTDATTKKVVVTSVP